MSDILIERAVADAYHQVFSRILDNEYSKNEGYTALRRVAGQDWADAWEEWWVDF